MSPHTERPAATCGTSMTSNDLATAASPTAQRADNGRSTRASGGAATAEPISTAVTATPGDAAVAHAHFSHQLAVETDVADVAEALAGSVLDFVLLDARSDAAYAAGHVPGAISLPHARITADAVAALPDGLIVAYCWGPSCNGATKAAVKLAALGRPVKEMIGGFEYWQREGHPVETRLPAQAR